MASLVAGLAKGLAADLVASPALDGPAQTQLACFAYQCDCFSAAKLGNFEECLELPPAISGLPASMLADLAARSGIELKP